MSKGVTTVNDVIKIIFTNGYDPAWRTNANLYIGLHTADPSLGDQTTSETLYTNYLRKAVVKTAVGWTIAGGGSQNAGQIKFNQCGAGGPFAPITHVSIGTVASPDAGQILYSGTIGIPLIPSQLVSPVFEATTLQTVET